MELLFCPGQNFHRQDRTSVTMTKLPSRTMELSLVIELPSPGTFVSVGTFARDFGTSVGYHETSVKLSFVISQIFLVSRVVPIELPLCVLLV